MSYDGIQIADEEAYLKSVTPTKPLTRAERLELIELYKEARKALKNDKKLYWYISKEIQLELEKVMRGDDNGS